jgi:hypothetical protein
MLDQETHFFPWSWLLWNTPGLCKVVPCLLKKCLLNKCSTNEKWQQNSSWIARLNCSLRKVNSQNMEKLLHLLEFGERGITNMGIAVHSLYSLKEGEPREQEQSALSHWRRCCEIQIQQITPQLLPGQVFSTFSKLIELLEASLLVI